MKTTTITLDELRRLTEENVVSLPQEEDDQLRPGNGSERSLIVEGRARSARVAELMRTIRELTQNRSHYDTVDLERWLDERED